MRNIRIPAISFVTAYLPLQDSDQIGVAPACFRTIAQRMYAVHSIIQLDTSIIIA